VISRKVPNVIGRSPRFSVVAQDLMRGNRHLDNKGVFPLVEERLTGAIK